MRPLILILGPTAGSKTSLAIELASVLPRGGECVIADSMQIYRGMDIGTAKPTTEEQNLAPHHLIDIADPSEDGFTVDTWMQHSQIAIDEIRSREKWPIIVGGTNLYVQSLLFGMFDGPDKNPTRRAELQLESNDTLHTLLKGLDSNAAKRIHINDTKRLVRAIEVCESTGQPISSLQSQWENAIPREDAILIGLTWPTQQINRRINARVKKMMENGLLQEVENLQDSFGMQAKEALGYKQLIAHLSGELSLEEAIEQIKILTRRYAKQQRTWLRRFQVLPNTHFIDMENKTVQHAVNESVTFINGLGFSTN